MTRFLRVGAARGAALFTLGLLGAGCDVGAGEGSVTSDRLYMEGCWDGPFDLHPDFFAANPFRDEALLIRIQRGDNIEEMSDGLSIIVNDFKNVRSQTGSAISVGLPSGIDVSGRQNDPSSSSSSFEPAPVSLALYLHSTCHTENGTIYSISGTITFESLFSGDPNEKNAEERLTKASFTAQFADPRQLGGDAATDGNATSTVNGNFSFYFQRGQPAQPFQ